LILAVNPSLGVLTVISVNIAHRHDPYFALVEESVQVAHAHRADTDSAHHDLVAGRLGPKDRRGNDNRKGRHRTGGTGTLLEKTAT